MKHQFIFRTMLLLMVLLSSLSTYAQNSMVGDGFGGRAGYCPTNYCVGNAIGFAVCGANNQVYAWGDNNYSQFGSATPSTSASPIAVPGMTNVRQFSGRRISSAIKQDGTGWVWGKFNTINFTTPVQMLSNAYFSAGGVGNAVFVKTDGTVWTVGDNSQGQYGIGTTTTTCSGPTGGCAVQMQGITNAKRVACAEYSTAILLADGTVMQVGLDPSARFPASLRSNVPVVVPGLSNIVDIKGNVMCFYALTSTGQVYSWGQGYAMGTGVAANTTTYMPTLVTFPAGAAPIKAISASTDGQNVMCLDENGNVYNWGLNSSSGRIGLGTTSYVTSPQLAASGARDIMTGEWFSYVIKTDRTVWAAGSANIFMNLSATTRTSYTQISPTAVGLCTPTVACYNALPPCVAGTTPPAVTPTTATNSCPTTTVNLGSLAVSSTTPSGASLIWSTNKVPTSAADTLTTAQKTAVSTAGTYYALYYDATNACYSPADSVVLTITSCVAPLTANTPAAQTATTGQAKTGNAATELAPTGGVSPYTYSNGSGDAACVAPSGATALTGLTVNSDGTYSYTAPATAGTYYYCIKVCDSTTPTASCIVKTYTLTVSAPPCNVTGIAPTFIKN